MPNRYVRKTGRGSWSQLDLTQAIEAVSARNVSVRQAALEYGVPRKTLERRLKSQNYIKGPMGPSSSFGSEHEKRLVKHILNMQKHCFPLTPKDLRSIAFHFAEQLGLKHSFNKNKQEAGYVWLQSFLSRNPEITLRKAEGVSIARTQSLNRTEVNAYFNTLSDLLEQYDLFDKPSKIFNMDESGLQLNPRPGIVLAQKGSKAVCSQTSTEKGETITVIACCNAEGVFLPPACIMKGKNKKQEWQDGMPPGSVLYMSQKSAYINTNIFFEWLKTHFLPRKPPGKVLLILDGHTSHCNSVEMLEFATDNDICLFTFPSHTTHYLQTLDRSVFKSLKAFYYEACRIWLKRNPWRRLTRLQFGELLSTAWSKAATYDNAVNGFKATGVYPFDRNAIPDYAFIGSTQDNYIHVDTNQLETPRIHDTRIRPSLPDIEINQPRPFGIQTSRRSSTPSLPDIEPSLPGPSGIQTSRRSSTPSLLDIEPSLPGPSGIQTSRKSSTPSLPDIEPSLPGLSGIQTTKHTSQEQEKSTSSTTTGKNSPSLLDHASLFEDQANTILDNGDKSTSNVIELLEHTTPIKDTDKSAPLVEINETPSKILNELSPLPLKVYTAKKHSKQVATILTSEKHIKYRKECEEKKNKRQDKQSKAQAKNIKGKKTTVNIKNENKKNNLRKKKIKDQKDSTMTDEEDQPVKKKIKKEKKELKKKNRATANLKKMKNLEESSDMENEIQPIYLESGDSSPIESCIDDCVGCGDNYYQTELIEDWIQCMICKRWVHENCTEFDDKCHPCGKIEKEKAKSKRRA
ncbi:uncharacterized protein LOC132903177 [Amyelois transitella]|uniref:uncharacterized protein LOC132903177 n=1 Tax=Amyelois transitella TaxID=680683 RepID=UPI00298F7070|nr:uncharacterized protein LOC132903177 [Amyelois transitella]